MRCPLEHAADPTTELLKVALEVQLVVPEHPGVRLGKAAGLDARELVGRSLAVAASRRDL